MQRLLLTGLTFLTAQQPHPVKPVQPKESLFNQLYQKSEDQYQKAQVNKKNQAEAAEPETQKDVKQAPQEDNNWSFFNLFRSKPRQPLLAKHKEFSDDWWKTLFNNCQGCKNSEEDIECDRLLEDNPQWQEVADMPRTAKDMVMRRALTEAHTRNESFFNLTQGQKACVLACAVCAGGNPDSRIDDANAPHTALHVVTGAGSLPKNYALFRLLLKKGADVNLECIPMLPRDMVKDFPDKWLTDLKRHGRHMLKEQ